MGVTDSRSLTFATLYTRGFRYLGMSLEEAQQDEELIDLGKTWVNEAVDELAAVFDWPRYSAQATLATIAGQDYIELPADYSYTGADSVPYYINNIAYDLNRSTRENVHKLRGLTANSGPPYLYYIDERVLSSVRKRTLELYPVPASVHSFVFPYYAQPTVMVNPTDLPDVDVELGYLLQQLVNCRFQENHEHVVESTARPIYRQQLDLAIARFGSRRHGVRLPLRTVAQRRTGNGEVVIPFNVTPGI